MNNNEGFSAVSEVNRLRDENGLLKLKIEELQRQKITEDEAKLLIMIQKCKIELKKQKLKKSGYNSHNKYHYFELDDFLSCVEIILDKHGLASFFKFEDDLAYLTIVNEDGASHTWTTKCLAPNVKENAYDFGVYMKPIQAIQTYARRTLWLQAMEITEPNTIESDNNNNNKPKLQKTKVKKAPIPADKLIQPIREEKTEEVTAERIKEILHLAQQRFDEAQEDKQEKDRRPFTWDNAKFLIRKFCNNDEEFNACQNSLIFKSADQV